MASAAVGTLVGRSAIAAAIRTTNTTNTTNNNTNNTGVSFSRKFSRPFFGVHLVALIPSGPKSVRWTKRAAGVVRMQEDDDDFDEDLCRQYEPISEFYKIEAVLRPWRLTPVSSALLKMGIRGVTVTDVRGFGAQGGSRERQAGTEFAGDSFLQKVKLEIVVSKDQVEAVINTVIDQARTGEIGDGKIFVSPVSDIIRIRTGERGLDAERMLGGRAAMQVCVGRPDEN